MRRILREPFFRRKATTVAKDLIGKFLVRRIGKKTTAAMITEVEAYDGFRDKASHAHRGKTARNATMFGPPGHWYVYFVYGMHWMLNIVTGRAGYPAAVLIRGLEGLNGPARLTKYLKIGKAFNGEPADETSGLWIEDRDIRVPPSRIGRGPRIGVDYAGEWAAKAYRYFLKP